MSEICLECWNKIHRTNDAKKQFVFTKELDLCEECGERKPVIIVMRKGYLLQQWFKDWMEFLRYRRKK